MSSEFLDAVRAGDVAKVRQMLTRDRSLADARTESGFSAVAIGKLHGHAAVLREILAANPTLDIHDAAYIGDVRQAQRLLDADSALLESVSSDGFTPLDLASYFGHRDLVMFLLERGAKVEHEIRNEHLFTALTGAVAEGHREIARALLDGGANVNHRYAQGATPLITAARNGDAEMVKLLIASGARTEQTNEAGETAAEVAADGGHGDIVTILRTQGSGSSADRQDPLRVSPESHEVMEENERVRVLLESMPPGGAIPRHRHPDHVLVALSGGRIASKSVHGRIERYDMDPGDTVWFPSGVHEVENLGPSAWKAALVELKAAERRA